MILSMGPLMCIAGSSDIFQAKMLELMVALRFVRAYIDGLLCITQASLDNHLQKLREVLTMLWGAGLRVNARKSKYLGYVLITDGKKPQHNKVQAIHALTPPTGVKDLKKRDVIYDIEHGLKLP